MMFYPEMDDVALLLPPPDLHTNGFQNGLQCLVNLVSRSSAQWLIQLLFCRFTQKIQYLQLSGDRFEPPPQYSGGYFSISDISCDCADF